MEDTGLEHKFPHSHSGFSSHCAGINWALCFFHHFIFPVFPGDWRKKHGARSWFGFGIETDTVKCQWIFLLPVKPGSFLPLTMNVYSLKIRSSSLCSCLFSFCLSPGHTRRYFSKKQVQEVKLNHWQTEDFISTSFYILSFLGGREGTVMRENVDNSAVPTKVSLRLMK